MQFRVCENCGSHLDPGEKCDCEIEKREVEKCKQEEKKKPVAAALNSFKS